jgi:hypothetical protein
MPRCDAKEAGKTQLSAPESTTAKTLTTLGPLIRKMGRTGLMHSLFPGKAGCGNAGNLMNGNFI